MTQEQTALELLRNSNGYLTVKTAGENGVKPITLMRMEERGFVERVARGLYAAADVIPDPFFVAQYRCQQGVFSHEPLCSSMIFPTGLRLS